MKTNKRPATSEIVEMIEQKFRSGNSVEIDRVWLLREEWEVIRDEIDYQTQAAHLLRERVLWIARGSPEPDESGAQDHA